MDEEEEVDVLGSYDDISKISSGQLLSCDYTVHPNWVNENAEGGSFWTDSVPKHENLESNVQVLQSEEVVIKEPEPVPHLMEYDWNRENSAQDDLVFEDDIPASIEEIVEEDTLKSSIPNSPNPNQCSNYDDQCYDGWDLAAFETHPPAKNAKYIGPTNPRSLLKVKIESQKEEDQPNSEDIRRVDSRKLLEKPQKKFRQTLTVSQNLIMSSNLHKFPSVVKPKKRETQEVDIKKSKFKQTVKMSPSGLKNGRFKFTERWRKNQTLNRTRRKGKKHKSNSDFFGENITISHEEQMNLMHSETVVKVEACGADSDIEVDIESDTSNEGNLLKSVANDPPTSVSIPELENRLPKQKSPSRDVPRMEISEELNAQLKDTAVPSEELRVDPSVISELEKYVHSEFFESRITKTPEQYLRIRNHILSMWAATKPNYISKTAVRSGLKQAGDVNCISRIHRLLEQIGAINFGHQGTYFEFIRPLEHFISTLAQPPRNRTIANSISSLNPLSWERRQRIRVNTSIVDNLAGRDANYTISHIDGIARHNLPSRNSAQPYARHIRTELDLVKCLKFSKDNIAPFKVSITLSTLLCLHLHALSSDHEVMGFLGGHRSKSVGRNKLSLTRYKPCRTSQQSGTMCEMCPISQVEQSSSLRSEGFELLGWFHSHPLFPPNPSRTDVETQKEMQEQFSFNDRPLVGMILSCLNFSLKCVYIMPKDLHSDLYDNGLPYELDVDVIKDCTDFKNDVKEVLPILQQNCDSPLEVIDKFKCSSSAVLQQYGYCPNTFFEGIFP